MSETPLPAGQSRGRWLLLALVVIVGLVLFLVFSPTTPAVVPVEAGAIR